MAIGPTTLSLKDQGGTSRAFMTVSSDAAATGNHAFAHVLLNPTTQVAIDPDAEVVAVPAFRADRLVQYTAITNTSETTIVTAGGASVFLDLYSLLITNTSATGVSVTIKSGTAGTTLMVLYVPATTTVGFTLQPGAGIKQVSSNTTWTATASGSVSTLHITAATSVGI